MNHIGSPDFITGVAYCAGNTAAINRYVYGWFPVAFLPVFVPLDGDTCVVKSRAQDVELARQAIWLFGPTFRSWSGLRLTLQF